jgi:hypothetical protein
LLETARLKATVENESANSNAIEELKKRGAVVKIMQSRMDGTEGV